LSPGGEATLENISWSGLMARCSKRLIPGVPVTVTVAGTFTPSVLKGRVARCEVGGIGKDGVIQYKIGVAFDEPVSLPDEDVAPVEESAALTEALEPTIENRW
jgi:hypothetical protein